jgi:hypothetical protein
LKERRRFIAPKYYPKLAKAMKTIAEVYMDAKKVARGYA